MKFTRRQFIDLGAKSALLLAASRLPIVGASENSSNFFVHIRTIGGIDSTLGLDPLTHAEFGTNNDQIFIEYRPEDILSSGAIRLGPAGRALLPLAGEFSLIRGIHMRTDIQHEPMNEFWVRADLSSSSPSTIFSIAERLGLGAAASANLPNSTSVRSRSLSSNSGSTLNPMTETEWQALRLAHPGTDFTRAEADEKRFQEIKPEIENVVNALGQGADPFLKEGTALSIMMNRGLVHVAVLDLNRDVSSLGNLDTHSDHEGNHLRVQTEVWEKVAELFKIFKGIELEGGRSLFDATTFLVTSEFSRTPFLNFSKGKDHNIHTNSVLLVGPRIRKGIVAGGSRVIASPHRYSSQHVGVAFDFSKGRALTVEEMKQLNPRSLDFGRGTTPIRQIFPEDVIATVLDGAFGSAAYGLVRGRKIRSLL